MNILYILRHNPWGIGGGCYACRCYLDAFTTLFAEAQFDVCVCEEYINENDTLTLRNTSLRNAKLRKCQRD